MVYTAAEGWRQSAGWAVVKQSLQRTRILAGQCPTCGKDAAPYRLCGEHRQLASLSRGLKRLAKAGAVIRSQNGRNAAWTAAPNMMEIAKAVGFGPFPLWGEGKGENDRRIQPRLGGMRVDVEKTPINILLSMGRPATLDEIQAAWGRLRGERKHLSLANDIAYIIESGRKRREKQARRALRLRAADAECRA